LSWQEDLHDRIQEILDRKRSSVVGREESLAAYIRILCAKYAREEVHGKTLELAAAFLKSVKTESSEKESVLALKALALTIVTEPSDEIFDAVVASLKRTITDSASLPTKVAAIRTLSCTTFYGGASIAEVEDTLEFFLEITESDGHSIGAPDDPAVVAAAIEEWGFLCTQLEEVEELTETAMDAFVEQLDSSEPSVQIAAGENIALLFEKSFSEAAEDEDVSSAEDDPEEEPLTDEKIIKMVQRYEPYRRVDLLKATLSELASVSSKRLSKKDRKNLHSNFSDILHSVENPTKGPRYQTSVSQETGRKYGSRLTVRVHKTGSMSINKWWKLHRLQALRRILAGGFLTHYENNEVVFESLPYVLED
jgi:hypothetical protein